MSIILQAKLLSSPCSSHGLDLDIRLDAIKEELISLKGARSISASQEKEFIDLINEIDSYKYMPEKSRNSAFSGFDKRVESVISNLEN